MVNKHKTYGARVALVSQETPQDRTFTLVVDAPPGAFAYKPGQFVMVTDPSSGESLRRAYSMSSAPEEGAALRLTVRDMGDFGHTFYDFPVGKTLQVEPPQGRFTLPQDERAPLVLAAGGSGVTPFRSYVRHLELVDHARHVWLFQSAQQAEELIFRAEFERIAQADWFTYVPTVTRAHSDDSWPGRRGRVDREVLASADVDYSEAYFHACGPGVFVKSVLAMSEELGVPKSSRKREQWG